ncbi:MAG: glycosyltransferase family 2 protein [Thermoplasmata archaeon]|nr:glycosyltransferase family 2 protein [Thermoplasmata archaeon]
MNISAIVMAHGRREFLRAAVDSARGQVGAPAAYEVIVTKDFLDPYVDQLPGIRILDSTGLGTGEMIADAAKAAHGELLAFLDDDDVWEPTKVSQVAAVFVSSPRLGYFGHGQSVINDAGQSTSIGGAMWRRQRWLSEDIEIPPPISGSVARFLWADPGNDSSITLRREDLLGREVLLRRIRASIDTFLLWTGLLSSGGIRFSRAPLTRLRVHPENFSRGSHSSFRAYVTQYRKMQADHLQSHGVVLEMAAGVAWAERIIRRRMHEIEHFLEVAEAGMTRQQMWTEFRAARDDPLRLRLSRALYVLSPTLSQTANFLNAMARW